MAAPSPFRISSLETDIFIPCPPQDYLDFVGITAQVEFPVPIGSNVSKGDAVLRFPGASLYSPVNGVFHRWLCTTITPGQKIVAIRTAEPIEAGMADRLFADFTNAYDAAMLRRQAIVNDVGGEIFRAACKALGAVLLALLCLHLSVHGRFPRTFWQWMGVAIALVPAYRLGVNMEHIRDTWKAAKQAKRDLAGSPPLGLTLSYAEVDHYTEYRALLRSLDVSHALSVFELDESWTLEMVKFRSNHIFSLFTRSFPMPLESSVYQSAQKVLEDVKKRYPDFC